MTHAGAGRQIGTRYTGRAPKEGFLVTADTTTGAKDQSWRGKIGGMDPEEVTKFLSGKILARLATIDETGYPYIVPIWFEWNPDDGTFWIIARKKSKWAYLIRDNPKVAMSIDEDESPLRKVTVQGDAELVEEPNVGGQWVQIAERMSLRYLGEHGPDYLVPTLDKPRWLFRIRPTNFLTWQGVDWHDRYKDTTTTE
jgi:PPOX class probable F420-dependent enzyme